MIFILTYDFDGIVFMEYMHELALAGMGLHGSIQGQMLMLVDNKYL